jgi:hypothetical protein
MPVDRYRAINVRQHSPPAGTMTGHPGHWGQTNEGSVSHFALAIPCYRRPANEMTEQPMIGDGGLSPREPGLSGAGGRSERNSRGGLRPLSPPSASFRIDAA